MHLTFEKYHGIGNDYLVFDCVKQKMTLHAAAVRMICDRRRGLGADGILEGPIYREGKPAVMIHYADGSIAAKSGNGVRIFAKYLKDAGYIQKKSFILSTDGGDVPITYLNEEGTRLTLSMGPAEFGWNHTGVFCHGEENADLLLKIGGVGYRCTFVFVGNPHYVILTEEISPKLVCRIGNVLEKLYRLENPAADRNFSERVTVQIVKIWDQNHIQTEIYELGKGYMQASGNACCAAQTALYRLGLTDTQAYVRVPGGELLIHVEEDWNIRMTGPACHTGKMILTDEFVRHYGL